MTALRVKTRRMLARHLVSGVLAAGLVGFFWVSRPTWTAEMRLWKSFGDSALILLLITLVIGPIVKLSGRWGRTLLWRREIGVWFGLMALVHTILILNGWARWSVARFFGYEFVEQLGRVSRMEPGFGLANLMGLIAIFWTLVLVATSSDRATRWLGASAWKWLHGSTHVVFYLVLLHTAYFLFIHFTLSFHKRPPPLDWFRIPFVVLGVGVVTLQMVAFAKVARTDRRQRESRRQASGKQQVRVRG